jgi:uncharacterized protein YlxW (UPF0749 family)
MMRNGIYDTLTYYGIELTVKKADKIKIGAFKGKIDYKYAKPVTEQTTNGGQNQ